MRLAESHGVAADRVLKSVDEVDAFFLR